MPRFSAHSRTTDKAFVYVAKRGHAYKIGFSRASVRRRVRDCDGQLVLVIPTGQQPSVLEYLINHRLKFAAFVASISEV